MAAGAAVWLAAGLSSVGCVAEPTALTLSGATSGATGGGGGGGDVTGDNQGEEMFRALQAELLSQCGGCHELQGAADTPFLGDSETNNPDPYEAATSWPGVIVKEPASSVLMTWPAGGNHQGGETPAALEVDLLAWLTEEAKAVAQVQEEGVPTIAPFKPIVPGFNAIYLDALGSEFLGMAVTFQAEELTDSSLSLSGIEVHPTLKKGVKVEHPLFTVFASGSADGDPDPIDSFSNVEQIFEAGQAGDLGPGTVVLTNWQPGGKLSIAFEVVQAVDPDAPEEMDGGTPEGACADLDSFQDNAVPALGNCTGCHGGNNQTATNAVDMSELGSDLDAACGQIKNRVNLDNPNQSQLFVTTDPNGNAGHPFKFGGNAGNFNNFVAALTVWINAEADAQ